MDLAEFYESIDLASVHDFLSTGREEDLYLDFKTSSNPMGRDDRKNFAIALSGFANSSGGLVVWGVEARKNAPDEADVAVVLRPISGLAKFLTDLNSFTGQFVTPMIDRVLHKKIEAGNDEGFVISLIPESSSGPHMAKVGEDRYYKRSASSFYRMEHFDLEDMFGRRPKPLLEFYERIERSVRVDAGHVVSGKLRIEFGLRNKGRGIARSPYLSVRVNAPYELSEYGIDGNGAFGLPRIRQAERLMTQEAFGGSVTSVVYPSIDLGVSKIQYRIPPNSSLPDLIIQYAIASEEVPLFTGTCSLTGAEIEQYLIATGN